ncbi:MAG: hypothetical protein WAL90_12690 [Desulfobacterales bacterium]
MAKISLTSIPTKSLINVIIFGGGIVLFVLLAILPAQRESRALDARIDEIRMRIKEEQILTPLYESLLKKAQMNPPAGLNLVSPEKLKRHETAKVRQTFQDLARQSDLHLFEYSPEIQSMIGEAGNMKVSLLLKGEFLNFQPFLLDVLRLPYLDRIEDLTIKSAPDTKEFRLHLFLVRE